MISKNMLRMVRCFEYDEQILPLKTLVFKCELSEKTIRTLILELKEYQESMGIEIQLIRSKGYQLKITNVEHYHRIFIATKNEEREIQLYILQKILQGEKLHSEEVMDAFYVSKLYLQRLIRDFKEDLKQFDLYLETKQYQGIRLIGSEKNIRKAIYYYFYEYKSDSSHYEEFYQVVKVKFKNINIEVSQIVMDSLVMHLEIAVERIRQNRCLMDIHEEIEHFDKTILDISESILKQCLCDDTDVPLSEVLNLYFHIYGKCIREYQEETEKEVRKILHVFYEKVNINYAIDLLQDEQLDKRLYEHIKVLSKRIIFDVQMKNPVIDVVMSNYQFAFELAVTLANLLSKYYKRNVLEDEIGFIAIYIGIALERLCHELNPIFERIAIVCTTGNATAKLLEHKIHDLFLSSELRTFPMFDVEKIKQFRPSLILSTINVEMDDIPVRVVNPMFFESDRSNVLETKKQQQIHEVLSTYFDASLFVSPLQANSQKEAIEMLSNRLFDKQIVSENFVDLCLQRERLASTCFGNYVALVHPMELCSKQTCAVVGILDKPMKWGSETVRIVFILAQAKGNEARDLMLFLQEIVFDLDLIIDLCEVRTYKRFMDIIYQHMTMKKHR